MLTIIFILQHEVPLIVCLLQRFKKLRKKYTKPTQKMVYIHIPEALTEEEQMLMAKYAKLKKKVRIKTKN